MPKLTTIGVANKLAMVAALKKLVDDKYSGDKRAFARAIHLDISRVTRALNNNVRYTDWFLDRIRKNTGVRLDAPKATQASEPEAPMPETTAPATTEPFQVVYNAGKIFLLAELMGSMSQADLVFLKNLIRFRSEVNANDIAHVLNAIRDVYQLKEVFVSNG